MARAFRHVTGAQRRNLAAKIAVEGPFTTAASVDVVRKHPFTPPSRTVDIGLHKTFAVRRVG
jgi:hypothetical protein